MARSPEQGSLVSFRGSLLPPGSWIPFTDEIVQDPDGIDTIAQF
ncbi:hypothetical protein [Streptomyces sp. NPDC048720]